MNKIIVNEEPTKKRDCILYDLKCKFCDCEGGYYDSLTFDFSKCPYCISIDKIIDDNNREEYTI